MNRTLSNSLIADSRVNCDGAELVWETVHSKLDNMVMEDVSIKRKGKVQMLESLLATTKIENNNVHINPYCSPV